MAEAERDVLAEARLAEAMAALPERLRRVLHERFYRERTLLAVGEDPGGLSRERVRQIESEALGQPRAALT